MGISLYFNKRKQYYCKSQTEYPEYLNVQKKIKQIIDLKRKTLDYESKMLKYFGVNINVNNNIPKDILIARYEEI